MKSELTVLENTTVTHDVTLSVSDLFLPYKLIAEISLKSSLSPLENIFEKEISKMILVPCCEALPYWPCESSLVVLDLC